MRAYSSGVRPCWAMISGVIGTDMEKAAEHPQFAARDKWREVMTENGPVRAMLPPFQFTDFEAVMGDVPSVGQHTDEVLRELGYAEAEIVTLHGANAV